MSLDILPQLLINSLIAGSIYALASSGLALTYGLLKILNFAHGHLMMVGVYMFFMFNDWFGYEVIGSAIGCIAVIAFIAYLSLKIFVLPFTRYSYVLSFVTTLALSTIFEAWISMQFGVNVKSLTTGFQVHSIEFMGIFITPIQIIIILSSIALLGCLAFFIHYTPYGRRLRAFSQNEYAAQGIGVSKTNTSYVVFIVGALLAAYAGVMVGYETNMQPTMGNAYTIKAFAAMVLGGLGNVWGTVAGSYLLGLVENLSIGLDFWGYSIPAGYKDAFAFMIILFVLLLRPQGLFNSKSRAA